MFHSLNEKVSYVKALIYLATIDQEGISEEEKIYIATIAKAYGIPEENIESLYDDVINTKDLETILAGIEDRKHKLMLVNELIAISYADGHYLEEEHAGVMKICEILGVEESKLNEIEHLMIRRIELEKETVKVLEMEE